MTHRDLGDVHVVAMAGGAGTRFWPLSRQARPKQLLTFGHDASLLAQTFERVASVAPAARWWMVVGESHANACREAVPALAPERVLVEPTGRNTAPAIALAAVHLAAEGDDPVMVVLPADHHVRDAAALVDALGRAIDFARQGAIVTLGVRPTRPETGYGYIHRGGADPRGDGGFTVARFEEKPDRDTAERFLASGDYDWNAGIFVMRTSVFLAEVQKQLPVLNTAFQRLAAVRGTDSYGAELSSVYEEIEGISVDYGIMEGAPDMVVVPVSCGWSDLGSLDGLRTVRAADEAGNVATGPLVAIDSEDCVVHNDGDHVVALVGVRDLVVVSTGDATLVVPADRAQEVREVVAALRAQGRSELL